MEHETLKQRIARKGVTKQKVEYDKPGPIVQAEEEARKEAQDDDRQRN